MGCAVDDVLPLGAVSSTADVTHHEQWGRAQPYVRYRELPDAPAP